MASFIGTSAAVVLCTAFIGAAAHAQGGKKAAEGAAPAEPCPNQATDLAQPIICGCTAGHSGGSVWGSGPYTADSNICSAALHAGAVGAAGGNVRVTPEPGQSSYSGTTANGITTSDWGSYGASFTVVAAGGAASALPVCSTIPSGQDMHSCACPSNPPTGSVWGSGPYTSDSDICSAAVHAGYIDETGGEVHVLRVMGLSAYGGTESYGVQSADWGAYGDSIVFDWNR